MDRADLIGIGIRFAAAAALSFLTVRYMVKFLDPGYSAKEENRKRVAKLFEILGLKNSVELNEHEVKIAMQFVGGKESGADWNEIGGCDELIVELKDRIILPLQIASGIKNPLLCPPRGVLLYGPPGCGKTLLAKAIAKAADCRDRQSHDHEATAMMKAQFMTLWDGFASTNDQIIVMGATNRPQDVDAAFLRRLPARFHVDLPTAKQREQILRVILVDENLADDIDLGKAAQFSDKLTVWVCRLAVFARAKATLADGGTIQCRQPLCTEDLINALHKYTSTGVKMIEHRLD